MSYTLKFSDSTKTTIVVPAMPPGINAVDTSLDLVGRGYPNYGEKIAQNFLYLLENFANQNPPENPIEGQLWYDTSDPNNKVLRVLDGANWPNVSGIYQQSTDPTLETNQGLKEGDIWVDTSKTQLKIYSSGDWITVGPSTSTDTGAIVATLPALSGGPYDVILNKVDGKVISVVTKDAFTPNPVIEGFTSLTTGTNLATGSILNGTALSALNFSINGVLYSSSKFLRKDNSGGETITGKVVYVTPADQAAALGRDGVVIFKSGDPNYIQFYKSVNDAVVLNNTPGGKLIFRTTGVTPGLSDCMSIEKSLVKINVTTESVSTTTGALVVTGGVAVGGDLHIGKKLYVNGFNLNTATLSLSNTAVSTSTTTGALTVAGGVGIGGSLNVGGSIALDNNFYLAKIATNPILAFNPNSYIAFNRSTNQYYFYNTATISLVIDKNYVSLPNTATSISTTTGALQVAGGVGIGGAVNIGQTSTIAGARILTTATAAIVYPEDFGAVGNGSTNDYGALQAAINTGKSVYLSDGKTYYYTTGLVLNNSYQRFGGPGILKPSGSINGVTITGYEGVEVDLTFNAPDLAGCAVRVDAANRVTIKKLHGVSIGTNNTTSSILYVQQCNTCVVDWMWAVTGGKGITWYGSDSLRSDILRINFAVLDCADDQYGLDWDGNCHSLEIGYLGLVGTKGAIIRNTYKDSHPSATTFPAIGRFNHIEIDYPTSHGIEITAGLDYDFNIPYILGAGVSTSSPGKSGIKIGSSINSYQVRINGGKSIGNTGYGIENTGGVVYFDGTTDLSNNVLGRKTGEVWTTLERLTLDDDNFYLTMNSGNPLVALSSSSTIAYDRTNKQLNFTIDSVGSLQIAKTYVQAFTPLITPTYTVGTLPSGLQGMRAIVSDANTSTFYSVAASGGSYVVPVYYTGSEWRIG